MKRTNVYGITVDMAEESPSIQAFGITYNTSTGVLTWDNGNSEQVIVIASESLIDFIPKNEVTYVERSFVCSGGRVVYRGKGESAILNLPDGLYFYFFGFNGVQSSEKYNREISYIFANPEANFKLREDAFYILREDGSKFRIEE